MTEPNRAQALRNLNFGTVDSESEHDLPQRFFRTADFDDFLDPLNWVVLGPKGTGKSALFELFTKYGPSARALAPKSLEKVFITAGTGFSDLTEIDTESLESVRSEDGYNHKDLWRLYIALRAGISVSHFGDLPSGPLKDFSKALGATRDWRVGPILKDLWKTFISAKLPKAKVVVRGVEFDFSVAGQRLDVMTLLHEINAALDADGRELWILFDKLDELYPTDPDERLRAIEGLMLASMDIRRLFPRIKPKVFLRSDIWRHLSFTNKSHVEDKKIDLEWSGSQLGRMLLKRAFVASDVWELGATREEALMLREVEDLTEVEVENALSAIFPRSVYKGPREATFMAWLVPRVTDGLRTVLPREAIYLSNQARAAQISLGGPGEHSLLTGESILKAYRETSEMRVRSYLAEFPHLSEHVQRFQGLTSATFERSALHEHFRDFEFSGDPLLREMCDVGLLRAGGDGDFATAKTFEVPPLYRQGLGLVIPGRP